ncbi:MAG: hypothetical protein KGR98_05100 [Verrucomicrobia bacterium]|nr:hypothetical protein [Verrucomicrobiota bacterium]MDE3099273.1 hypothetical protein [Verrucomicrobiota bacterium]
MPRLVQPEILDALPPSDPRALRCRRDLCRVNFWMANHSLMARALDEHWPDATRQIAEIGAGDGQFLLGLARRLKRRNVNAMMLDRHNLVSTKTLAAFSEVEWRAETAAADVFDWMRAGGGADIIIANLFIHQFEDAALKQLFQAVSRRALLFVALEPHRFYFPAPCAQMLRLVGCGADTRHDAALSIRAGFLREELSALWPERAGWQLTERRAGWFSHLFIAKKFKPGG